MRRVLITLALILALAAPALAAGKPADPTKFSDRELRLEGQNIVLRLQLMQSQARQLQQRLGWIKQELKRRADAEKAKDKGGAE